MMVATPPLLVFGHDALAGRRAHDEPSQRGSGSRSNTGLLPASRRYSRTSPITAHASSFERPGWTNELGRDLARCKRETEFCAAWFARVLDDNAPLVFLAAIAVAFPYGKACFQITYIHKHATAHSLSELAALARQILPLGTGKTGEVEPNRLHTWFFSRVNRRGIIRGYGLVGSRKQAKEPYGYLALADSVKPGEVVKAFVKAEGIVHFRYEHPRRPEGGGEDLTGSISSGSGDSLSTLSTASSSSLASFANFDFNHAVDIITSSNNDDDPASTFPYVPPKTSLAIRPDSSSSPLPIGFLPSFVSSDSSFAILAHAHVHDGPFLICTDYDRPAEFPVAVADTTRDDSYDAPVAASVERVYTWLGSVVHGEVEIVLLPRLTDEEEEEAEVEAEENEEMRVWRWSAGEEARRERKKLGSKVRDWARRMGVFGKRGETLL